MRQCDRTRWQCLQGRYGQYPCPIGHLELDHRGIKQRIRPMGSFKSVESAKRFCRVHEEVRNFLWPCSRRSEVIPLAQRRLFYTAITRVLLCSLAAAWEHRVTLRPQQLLLGSRSDTTLLLPPRLSLLVQSHAEQRSSKNITGRILPWRRTVGLFQACGEALLTLGHCCRLTPCLNNTRLLAPGLHTLGIHIASSKERKGMEHREHQGRERQGYKREEDYGRQ